MMKTVQNYIPLCWVGKDRILVCDRKSQLVIHDLNDDSKSLVCQLPLKVKERFFMHFNLSARAMRLVNFTGCPIDGNRILIAYRSVMYLVDIDSKNLRSLFRIDKGKRPLFFCYVKEETTHTKSGIYYGDYCGNHEKNPINIYHIDTISFEKRIVYTFEKGVVNHIHNIVYDGIRDCMWVFSGDFGDAAAIWRTNDGFKTVECVLKGNQDYRADVVTLHEGSIWYATDAPFAPNHLMRLYESEKGWQVEKISTLNGPVIYGGKMGENMFFSTDVESDGRYKNKFDSLTSRKLGKGIKDYYAYLYTFNLQTKELKIVYQCKKDCFPFVVFQFGAIMFPHGDYDGTIIPAFHVALNKHQLKTLMIRLDGNTD